MNLEFHPVANIFPLLYGEEFEALKRDIQENGLREAIWLHQDGRILDGRNRYRACDEAGIKPKFEVWDGEGSLVGFVVSLNLHRRHLDSSQRAAIAVEVLPMLEKEAKERQRLAGGSKLDLLNNSQPLSQKIGQAVVRNGAISRCLVCSNLYDKSTFPDACPYCYKEAHNLPGWVDGLPQMMNGNNGKSSEQAATLLGTNRQYVSDAKRLKAESPELFEQVKAGELTIPQAKQEIARQRMPEPAITPEYPTGKYRCIVIDPPWPMQKIERKERPNQGIELDYPTMTLEEIEALPVGDWADDSGCHLYLWVTQKFLPAGLHLVEEWGFRYQCLMTWRKNVGFTPYSWMYDTEHVIFARRGNLPLQELGLRLSFDAPVNGHSAKPDIFYEQRVKIVSPEPRIDVFARKHRPGFEVWGNEL